MLVVDLDSFLVFFQRDDTTASHASQFGKLIGGNETFSNAIRLKHPENPLFSSADDFRLRPFVQLT